MGTKAISRRQLLKGEWRAGRELQCLGSRWRERLARRPGSPEQPALALAAPLQRVLGDLDATQLDSWLAVAQDGSVTVFTSKVELGTGVETALAQMVAEELDVPFRQIKMDTGDTSKTIDQGMTVAARTVERAGPQLRQAAAAARQELLKLASARLQAPAEQLTVRDGVVSVAGNPAKKISYGELIGGRRFDLRITATGQGWTNETGSGGPRQRSQGLQDRRHFRASYRSAGEVHWRVHLHTRCPGSRDAPWPRGSSAGGEFEAFEH